MRNQKPPWIPHSAPPLTARAAAAATTVRDGAVIQAAIDHLPTAGGTVEIAPGLYELTEPLYLGDGGPGRWSRRAGIVLRAAAPPQDHPQTSSVVLRKRGAGPIIAVLGPLVGWGLENLYLDGAGEADVGIYVQSAQMGRVANLIVSGVRYYGIQSTSVPPIDGRNTDALHNHWHNLRLWMLTPALQAYGAGISLDTTSGASNTCLNTFMNTFVIVAGAPAVGLRLGGCDTNFFWGLHLYVGAGTRGLMTLDFDNPGSALWPCNNQIFGMTVGPNATILTTGTPDPDTCGNMVWGWNHQGALTPPLPVAPTLATLTTQPGTQDVVIVPGSNPAAAQQPHGNLRLQTSADAPHHLVPSVSHVSDLGAPAQTFRNLYLSGKVIYVQPTPP